MKGYSLLSTTRVSERTEEPVHGPQVVGLHPAAQGGVGIQERGVAVPAAGLGEWSTV